MTKRQADALFVAFVSMMGAFALTWFVLLLQAESQREPSCVQIGRAIEFGCGERR